MNSFGRLFRIHIHGESHGFETGVTIDGCPAGLPLSEDDFLSDLARRRSGAPGTTPRREADIPRITAGVFNGKTTGAPIMIRFDNRDTRSGDYRYFQVRPRPGHADFSAMKKFRGYNDPRGGGMFSGRLTLAIVAAGVVAKKLISPMEIHARLLSAGGEQDIDRSLEQAAAEHDSLGGLVSCRAEPVPAGLGEPFFDSLESLLSHILFSIPGIKGVEFGDGFASAAMKGSQYNDPLENIEGKTADNHAGGINGGISNGNPVLFRVAARPTASIGRPQKTINLETGAMESLEIIGRHDTCFALRLPVVVEAAAAIVFADLLRLNGLLSPVWDTQ